MRPGDIVAGRFEVKALAGEGGMGVVYRALDRELGQEVALKVLRGEADESFQREAQLLSHLAHPGIVRCIAFGKTDDEQAYLATEWLEGETLRARLARQPPLQPSESIELARRVAEALAAAHAWGVVHRDVTPANILLLEGGNIKLLDFGIARVGPRTLRTETTSGLGTPGYLSPEQARGDDRVDARADVFSLGCVLFECLTGKKAFEGDHAVAVLARVLIEDAPRVRSVRRDIPKPIDELVAKMLSRDPAGRPADGGQAAALLSGVRTVLGQSTIPPPAIASKTQIGSSEARVTTVVVAGRIEPSLHEAIEKALSPLVRVDWLSSSSLVASAAGEAGRATEPALRAARAAQALRKLAEGARIAVSTGRSRMRRSGSGADWIGDALDRAVELSRQDIAKTAIPLDDATAGLLSDRFDVVREGASLLLGPESVARSRTLLGRETPCIGRDREIDVVMTTWEECTQEPVARVVLLTGAPGIGKSRVREEVVRRVREQSGALVWSARGDPTGTGEGFGLLAQLVRSAAGIGAEDDRNARRSRLLACVRANVPEGDVSRVAEFLGELVGAAFGEPSVQLRAAREDPVLLGDQVRRAFEDLVLCVIGAQSLVIAVDDLQWGDSSSVRALDAVVARAKEMPLLLFALGRPEVKDAFPKLWAAREPLELALGRLPPRAIEKIVRAALGDVAESTMKDLVERSGGNAFFLEELVRAVAAGQKGALPDSVLAVVQARLDALEPEARRVLRAASFFSRGFTPEAIVALAGAERGRAYVDPWLAWLVEREFIVRRDGQTYAFRHALVRDAAYATLTDEDRSLGHLLAAKFLEAQDERDSAFLAEQYERGGAPAEAARCWLAAAGQALEVSDLAAVLDRASRSLPHASPEDAGAARLLMAEAHRWRGEYDAAAQDSKLAMVALPAASVRWFQASAEAATAATALGDKETLASVADALAREANPEAPAIVALARVAIQLMASGDVARADVLLERATTAPPVEGALLAQARVEQALALRAALQSWFGESAERTMRSLDAFQRAGDTRNACNQQITLAHALAELGQNDAARKHLEQAIGVAEQAGLVAAAANGRHLLGILAVREGDTDRAIELERGAREVFRARGNARLEGGALCWLALAYLAKGDRAGAGEASSRAVELLDAVPPALALALATRARVLLESGDVAGARETAERARALVDRAGGVDTGEAFVRLVHAEVLHASGAKNEARRAIELAKARLLERQARIRREEWRDTFIARVPDHARTFALADAWS